MMSDLITIVDDNPEETLADVLGNSEEAPVNRNILQCKFSKIELEPDVKDINAIFEGVVDDESFIYLFEDGDILLQWSGRAIKTTEALREKLEEKYDGKFDDVSPDDFFQHYDFHAHGEALKEELRGKIKVIEERIAQEAADAEALAAEEAEAAQGDIDISHLEMTMGELDKMLKSSKSKRVSRSSPMVLIVEDQEFYQQILRGAIQGEYDCAVAPNGNRALELYALHAPDIVLVDIGLPDISGHMLAKIFREKDPHAYIIMVTGNSHKDDVEFAVKNKVDGFIAKPFNRDQILACIKKFKKHVAKDAGCTGT